MDNWVNEELSRSHFGDTRLSKRFKLMVEQLFQSPTSSIPEAMGSQASTKAAYRFWDSKSVNVEKILTPHRASTVERMANHSRVLAIQDTSSFDYTHHPSTAGLGYLELEGLHGIKIHSLLALTPEGIPLGILKHTFWTRPCEEYGKKHQRKHKPLEQKESYRWLATRAYADSWVPDKTEIIHIADREADIYELFAMPHPEQSHLLIRAQHNRSLQEGSQKLFSVLEAAQEVGSMSAEVSAREGHLPRTAQLSLRYAPVHLAPPQSKKKTLPPVRLNAIEVYEPHPPEGGKPVRWVLLTTLAIHHLEEVKTYVSYYTLRWLIERYFYTLKSGCKVEELQLETADRLEKAIATYAIVAWRLLYLMYQSRKNPQAPADTILQTDEWETLYYITHKKPPPSQPPSLEEAVLGVAKLGGFLARKSDGQPGIKTLWRGLMRLQNYVEMYSLLKSTGYPYG